jgi:hypothetical protein
MGRWTNWETAEQLFLEEQRDKQQERQNLRAKSGRGGSRSGTKKSIMPFESMSKAEQKQYTQAGEMRVFRMIMPIEQFKEFDKPKRKEYLEELLKTTSKQELARVWGNTAYHYLEQAGLHQPQKSGEPRMTKKKRTALLLEQEREQIAASKEKLENDVIEAFTAAEDAQTIAKEAQRAAKSLRNELDVSKQSFIQSLDATKKYFMQQQEHIKAELLKEMQHAVNIICEDHKKEIQGLHEIMENQNTKLSIMSKVVEEQEKEIAALRDQVESTTTAIGENENIIEKLCAEFNQKDDNYKYLETKLDKFESLSTLTHTAPANNNNELLSRVRTVEIDLNLLKQLAIR